MKTISKLDECRRFITGEFFEEASKGYTDIYDEKSPIVEGIKKGFSKVKEALSPDK
jgi:alcohol dehydrogenase (NADP+)